jgi:hypothetical protein
VARPGPDGEGLLTLSALDLLCPLLPPPGQDCGLGRSPAGFCELQSLGDTQDLGLRLFKSS